MKVFVLYSDLDGLTLHSFYSPEAELLKFSVQFVKSMCIENGA